MWTSSECAALTFFRAEHQRQRFRPHSHESFTICAVESGVPGVRVGGGEHRIEPGSFSLILPGEIHSGECLTRDVRYRLVYVPMGCMKRILGSTDGSDVEIVLPERNPSDPGLARDFLAAHRRAETGGDSDFAAFYGVLSRVASRYFRAGAPNGRPGAQEHWAARRVRDHIERNSQRNVTLQELSELVGLTRYHLLRVFRSTYGLPPHSYLIQARVRKAKARLLEGGDLAEVALDLGFSDQSHFGYYFKSVVGLSPGQFARR